MGLIMIGAAITSGAHNGASAGFDEWDTKEENWVPGRGGFIGANGAGATPKVINAGVSATFSAALVAVLADQQNCQAHLRHHPPSYRPEPDPNPSRRRDQQWPKRRRYENRKRWCRQTSGC